MKQGILIVAVGSPYYGRLAFNLAVSIKAVERDFPVVVLTDARAVSHLTENQQKVFDQVITDETIAELKAGSKLQAYARSPFDQTLVIDADNLWLQNRTPSELFQELDGVKFTAITEGFYDIDNQDDQLSKNYPLWADRDAIIAAYSLKSGKLYQWRSEVFYFERSEIARNIFKKAKAVFKDPKVDVTAWAGNIPDEFALNVAAAQLGVDPHVYNWQPVYWDRKHRGRVPPPHEIARDYFIFSSGGNAASSSVVKTYNQIAAYSHKKLGQQFLFLLSPKRSVLTERQKM